MKVIIPYREKSERCVNKNTREFFEGQSILDLSVEHLKDHDVTLACILSPSSTKRAIDLDVKQMTLSSHTATGSWSELAVDIAERIDCYEHKEPIAFIYCTCPVFYQFNLVNDFLLFGKEAVESGKSAIVVEPLRHYIVDKNSKGVNFKQGEGHQYSQNILQWYSMPGVLTVTTPEDMLKHKYWYSPEPIPLEAVGPCLDIDTEEDFKIAKIIYAALSQYLG